VPVTCRAAAAALRLGSAALAVGDHPGPRPQGCQWPRARRSSDAAKWPAGRNDHGRRRPGAALPVDGGSTASGGRAADQIATALSGPDSVGASPRKPQGVTGTAHRVWALSLGGRRCTPGVPQRLTPSACSAPRNDATVRAQRGIVRAY
jgi:hypothetical protein